MFNWVLNTHLAVHFQHIQPNNLIFLFVTVNKKLPASYCEKEVACCVIHVDVLSYYMNSVMLLALFESSSSKLANVYVCNMSFAVFECIEIAFFGSCTLESHSEHSHTSNLEFFAEICILDFICLGYEYVCLFSIVTLYMILS